MQGIQEVSSAMLEVARRHPGTDCDIIVIEKQLLSSWIRYASEQNLKCDEIEIYMKPDNAYYTYAAHHMYAVDVKCIRV